MSNSILKTLQKKNMTQEQIDAELRKLNRNNSLLPINVLSTKQVNPEIRRAYLLRISELFSLDEIISRWKTTETIVSKFYFNNDVPMFRGKNSFEKEINILLFYGTKHGEVRRILHEKFSEYRVKSFLTHYSLTEEELKYYCHLIGINMQSYNDGSATKDLPSDFSLVPYPVIETKRVLEIKKQDTTEEKGNIEKAMDIQTSVDVRSGIVLKTNFTSLQKNREDEATRKHYRDLEKEFKNPISIIAFLKFSYDERKHRLITLADTYKMKSDVIEKTLGIPSTDYFRKMKTRHMIFDFYNKEELKQAFSRFKTFEECQNLVLDIIKKKRFREFKVSEKTFIAFADKYFDVVNTKNGWITEDWEIFCKKLVKQTIYVYKKNTRVTNLTEAEVLEYDKDNRKIIPERDLIRIVRTVIKDIHDDNQNWISIFDFKTAIEKNGFELDSNDRIVELIDQLIEMKSFRNEYFTLKKIPLDNPILSNESSLRWEFVSTKPTPVVEKREEIPEQILINTDNAFARPLPELDEEAASFIKNTENIITNSKPVTKKNFLTSNSVNLTFDESNIDDVMEFIKLNFKMFGSGQATITISKDD